MHPNIIVTKSASDLRAIARKELKGNWGRVSLVSFVYVLLTSFINGILSFFASTSTVSIGRWKFTYTSSDVAPFYNLLIAPVFAIGLLSFFLTFFRQRRYEPYRIFDGFRFYLKSFGLYILVLIKIILWSLLFIIPGIVAAVRYSQAPYILAEDPTKSPIGCIEESKFLMEGNKEKYFTLLISFIGWGFLASIPVIFLQELFSANHYEPIMESFAMLFVLPPLLSYLTLTRTIFFEIVTGHLRFRKRS
ncbi:MAG: DUF975 family protein [Eubacteriales bacterium]|nr:DUF975 family protein [Eubacteriales bacterium]